MEYWSGTYHDAIHRSDVRPGADSRNQRQYNKAKAKSASQLTQCPRLIDNPSLAAHIPVAEDLVSPFVGHW